MAKKPGLLDRLNAFDQLTDAEQVRLRVAWLEQKMVEVLYFLISSVSLLVAGVAGLGLEKAGSSNWITIPTVFLVFFGLGFYLRWYHFRGAPPHIDFLNP